MGEIVVQMPSYVEALNEAFRYQLTAIGTPAPSLHIKQELTQGQFVVAGAAPGQRVCWQITGNRRDPFARANPLLVEEYAFTPQWRSVEASACQPRDESRGIPGINPGARTARVIASL
jgi:hypothetical protein